MKELDKPICVKLGKQLKQARLNKGYSLAEVAEMVGKSKVSIKRYEDASVRIDMDTLKKISDILGMQVMDTQGVYNGEVVDHVINLYPKFEEMIQHDEELQEAGRYFERLSERMMKEFIHLDINLQKSILMMLKFNDDEIDEVMKFLH